MAAWIHGRRTLIFALPSRPDTKAVACSGSEAVPDKQTGLRGRAAAAVASFFCALVANTTRWWRSTPAPTRSPSCASPSCPPPGPPPPRTAARRGASPRGRSRSPLSCPSRGGPRLRGAPLPRVAGHGAAAAAALAPLGLPAALARLLAAWPAGLFFAGAELWAALALSALVGHALNDALPPLLGRPALPAAIIAANFPGLLTGAALTRRLAPPSPATALLLAAASPAGAESSPQPGGAEAAEQATGAVPGGRGGEESAGATAAALGALVAGYNAGACCWSPLEGPRAARRRRLRRPLRRPRRRTRGHDGGGDGGGAAPRGALLARPARLPLAAAATPLAVLAASLPFLAAAAAGPGALGAAVAAGQVLQAVSRAGKYALLDPAKDAALWALADAGQRRAAKARVDVLAQAAGKALGAALALACGAACGGLAEAWRPLGLLSTAATAAALLAAAALRTRLPAAAVAPETRP
eukprot:tig00000718_g3755.t1